MNYATTRAPEECRAWEPSEGYTCSEWAEKKRILDQRYCPEPGPWRNERTPYLAEIMDSLSDVRCEEVTVKKATQIGVTEAALNFLGYIVDQDPGPALLVVPREDDVKAMVYERLKPVFEDSPDLAAYMTRKKADWVVDRLQLKSCRIKVAASQSPADLAAFPQRYLFGDECDKWPESAGDEAPPFDLARERLRTYQDKGQDRTVLASTPVTDRGLMWTEFEASRQYRFHIPCPTCGHFQTLQFERIDFADCDDPDEMAATLPARYRCIECEELWGDRDRIRVMERGVWCPADGEIDELGQVQDPKPDAPHRGFHLWAGYSPFVTFSRIAEEYLRTRGTPKKEQHFANSWLGEPWQERLTEPKKAAIRLCISTHKTGEVPDDVLVLTAGIDCQKRDLWYTVWGWGYDEESWLIKAGRCLDWPAVQQLLVESRWGKKNLRIQSICIDARGGRREEVHQMARRFPDVVRPVMGTEFGAHVAEMWRTRKVDTNPTTGAKLKTSIVEWSLNVRQLKDTVALRLLSPDLERGQIHLPEDASEELLSHLESEKKVRERKRSGHSVTRWVKKSQKRANHWWDTAIYAYAGARMMQVHALDRQAVSARRDRARRIADRRRRRAEHRREGRS